MLVSSGITVFLGKTEVDDVNKVAFLAETHQKIVRLNIPMDKIFWMYVFNSANLENEKHEKVCNIANSIDDIKKFTNHIGIFNRKNSIDSLVSIDKFK